MDFESLLHVAQRNSQNDNKAQPNKFYSTKFDAPKKLEKDKKLSANIQKFLQKKNEEEKEKQRQAQENLKNLLAMRTEKDKNKIKKMLKTTKSANKSVLADAVDNNNTAITLIGPEQPDEDDYGYTSQEASQLYRQLMDKYKKDPNDDKPIAKCKKPNTTVIDLSNTKNRVKAAIQRAQEEELIPSHKRQRQSCSKKDDAKCDIDDGKHLNSRKILYDPEAERLANEEHKREEQKLKAKQRKPPPPVMDFRQLLQLAEQKQFEPVEVEVDVKPKDPERLLTNKEKRELEEKNRYFAEREKRKQTGKIGLQQQQQSGKQDNSVSNSSKLKTDKSKNESPRKSDLNGRIPKHARIASTNVSQSKKSQNHTNLAQIKNEKKEINNSSCSSSNSNSVANNSKLKVQSNSLLQQKSLQLSQKGNGISTKPSNQLSSKSTICSNSSSTSSKVQNNGPKQSAKMIRDFPPKDLIQKTMQSESSKSTLLLSPIKSKQSSSYPRLQRTESTMELNSSKKFIQQQRTRQFPPPHIRNDRKKPPAKRPIIGNDDDDSEYDSEMDDFIDDGPEEGDYSKYIKEIFGYDKSRYRDRYEDVDNMESSFSQQMREEYISKKMGIMEDLEDMRMEAEEKKKAKMKKQRIK